MTTETKQAQNEPKRQTLLSFEVIMSAPLSLKVSHLHHIRRFSLPNFTTLSSLLLRIRTLFALPPTLPIVLFYKSSDKLSIPISTESTWNNTKAQGIHPLRLYMVTHEEKEKGNVKLETDSKRMATAPSCGERSGVGRCELRVGENAHGASTEREACQALGEERWQDTLVDRIGDGMCNKRERVSSSSSADSQFDACIISTIVCRIVGIDGCGSGGVGSEVRAAFHGLAGGMMGVRDREGLKRGFRAVLPVVRGVLKDGVEAVEVETVVREVEERLKGIVEGGIVDMVGRLVRVGLKDRAVVAVLREIEKEEAGWGEEMGGWG